MIDVIYSLLIQIAKKICKKLVPYFRRGVRLLALPYCYIWLVDWEECRKDRFSVMKDLVYIFFRLKYFPDNYAKCRLWEMDRDEWKYYYGSIYEPYQRYRLQQELQKEEYKIIFKDKFITYQMCKAGNLPVPGVNIIVEETRKLLEIITAHINKTDGKLIIKPAEGRGAKDIYFAFKDGKRTKIVDKYGKESTITTEGKWVVQNFVEQEKRLSAISDSVNTVRVITLLKGNGRVLIVGAMIRFGLGNTLVDNISAGGVGVGVHVDTGQLFSVGYDEKGKKYEKHPTSGAVFQGFCVPGWKEVIALAAKTQDYFCFYKLLATDIAITDEGPVILEINGEHDNVGFEQKVGPILKVPGVLEEFENKELLVNKEQLGLCLVKRN